MFEKFFKNESKEEKEKINGEQIVSENEAEKEPFEFGIVKAEEEMRFGNLVLSEKNEMAADGYKLMTEMVEKKLAA